MDSTNSLNAALGALAFLGMTACGGTGGATDASTAPGGTVATTLSISGGDAQTAFAGFALAVSPSVIVRDQHGAAVAGVGVVFSITAGGGSLVGAAQTTNASGVASLGAWTLGASTGLNTLEVKASGIPIAVTFTAIALSRTLTVVTNSDAVNGTISGPAALIANPGPDGISLREALRAAANSSLPFEIRFAASMAGQTITPATELPHITADGTQLIGLAGADGQPAITLDGDAMATGQSTLRVAASRITISGLRFTHVHLQKRAIHIGSGGSSEPQDMSDILVTGNVIDNDSSVASGFGIVANTDGPRPQGSLVNLSFTKNTFRHHHGEGDALLIDTRGQGSSVRNVNVSDNTFVDCTFCLEFAHPSSTDCLIRGVWVTGNTFERVLSLAITPGMGPVTGAVSVRNRTDTLVIAGNTFRGGGMPLYALSGYAGASNNIITDVWFTNNVVIGEGLGIGVGIGGGNDAGTTGNHLSNVVIASNTFSKLGWALLAVGGQGGATNSSVSAVSFLYNTVSASANGAGLRGGSLSTTALGNRVDSVVVAGNIFSDVEFSALNIQGAADGGSGAAVTRAWFVNNIVQRGGSGIAIFGGDATSAGDTVRDIHAVNNTIYRTTTGVTVQGSSRHAMSGIDVRNSIFWAPVPPSTAKDLGGELTAYRASFNIVNVPTVIGTNGNFYSDPLFAAAESGDFHLQPASPAIRAGTRADAPATDQDRKSVV